MIAGETVCGLGPFGKETQQGHQHLPPNILPLSLPNMRIHTKVSHWNNHLGARESRKYIFA